MEAYIAVIVILSVLVAIFFILMGSIREGKLARIISLTSLIVLLVYWNPIHLKKLLLYSPYIFKGYIFVTLTLYIFTMLSFEVFKRQKDTYAILGFNFKANKNSSKTLVQDTLNDLNIPYETREDFTLIYGVDKINYYKKNIIMIEVRDIELKKKIKKGMGKRLSYKITFSSIIASLLSVFFLSLYLIEAIKLFLYIINMR